MLGLKPWEPDESVPRLTQPAFEARVGDAVAVPTVDPAVAVVEAAVAPGRAELVGHSQRPRPERGEAREGALAVGPGLAVAVAPGEASPVPPAPLPVSPAPESAPVSTPSGPELASAPVPPPSAAPEAQPPRGPVSAGTPELPGAEEGDEACAGDEYVLRITPLEGEVARLLLEHIAADGSVETQELEGDLEDARDLVLRLSSEGGCVEVEVLPPGDWEEAAEPAPVPLTPAP